MTEVTPKGLKQMDFLITPDESLACENLADEDTDFCAKPGQFLSFADLRLTPLEMLATQQLFEMYRLLPEELLAKKKLLQVAEAAYVLNMSVRHVRNLINEGRLRRTKDYPTRVLSEDVKAMVEDVDVWDAWDEGSDDADLDARALALGLDR